MAVGSAPIRLLPGVWQTANGRRLTAAGNRYWEARLREGSTDGKGHYNHQRAKDFQTARHGPTRVARTAAGQRIGRQDEASQYAFEHSGGIAGELALGLLTPRGYLDPVGQAIAHPTAGNVAWAGVGFLPIGRAARAAKIGLRAVKDAGQVAREAKIAKAGLNAGEHGALVHGDLVTQVHVPRSRTGALRGAVHKASAFSEAHPDLPYAGSADRTAKLAGRANLLESARMGRQMVKHTRIIERMRIGSAEDTAHFWWAQMPAKLRNVAGLRRVANKLNENRQAIISGDAEKNLLADLQNTKFDLAQAEFGTPEWKSLMQDSEYIQQQIADLPFQEAALSRQIGRLEHAIDANPKLNPQVLHALSALEKDRRNIGIASGRLNAESAAERTGLVSRWLGEEPTGEEIYMGHRSGGVGETNPQMVVRSPGAGRVRSPQGFGTENRGVLLNTARLQDTTHVGLEDWRKAHVFRSAVKMRDDAWAAGKEYKGGPWDQANQVIVNRKGIPIPRGWHVDDYGRMLDMGFDEQTIREQADKSMQQFMVDIKNMDPHVAEQELQKWMRNTPLSQYKDLRLVDRRWLNRYASQLGAGRLTGAGKVYDNMLAAVMTTMIFARVGYVPKNVVQNLIMVAPHQGIMFAFNAPRAAQIVKGRFSGSGRELWDLLSGEVGGGATMGATEGLHGKLTGKFTQLVTNVADAPLRISSFLHEAAAEGIISPFSPILTETDKQKLIALLKNPANRAKLNDIADRAIQNMGDFNRLNPAQRRLARRLFIVPNWMVAGTRYPLNFILTHPYRTAGLSYLAAGEPGSPVKLNKPIDEYLAKGVPPYATGVDLGSHGVLRVGSLMPASFLGDVALAVATNNPMDLTQYANPFAVAIVMVSQGLEQRPTWAKKVGITKALWEEAKRLAPNYKFIKDMIDQQGSTTYPQGDWLHRFLRETGVAPVQVSRGTSGAGDGSGGAGGQSLDPYSGFDPYGGSGGDPYSGFNPYSP